MASMAGQPVLQTARLIQRPFTLADAPDVQRLAGDEAVASTTQNIPHPYEDGMAEAWIRALEPAFGRGALVTFAITRCEDGQLLGAIGLTLAREHERAEMGYWIGVPFWNQGYATEAASAVLGYAFRTLGLNKVYAQHLARNPASGRVMEKAGMSYEGLLRQHVKKWDVFEDLKTYSILRSEFEAASGERRS
jgi:RimJ/RimL family protein N-acetyltransferase